MKRYSIFLIALSITAAAAAQSPVDKVLQSVAANNSGMKAVRQQALADKASLSAENSLENLSFEFEYLWREKHLPGGNKYGFAVMQGFDFPSLYVQRRKLIDAQGELGEWQEAFARQSALLQARECCIRWVYLNKQIALVGARVAIADTLVALYHRKLQEGDANQLEVNKVEIERLSQSTRLKMLHSERAAVLSTLMAYNGGQPLPVATDELTEYPMLPMPASLQEAMAQWQNSDALVGQLKHQGQMAELQASVTRQGWIPKFELGYKQAYEEGDMFYGLAVGIALPLFKTHSEVKVARAKALSLSWQADDAGKQADAEAVRLYDEAAALQQALSEYDLLVRHDSRSLLMKALQGGSISLLEYMADMAQLNEADESRLLIEYRYYSTLSQLNRGSL